MIAARDDIHTARKDFQRRPGRDAGTTRGVLAVGDDEMQTPLLEQFWHQFRDRLASGCAHDVTDKQNLHPEKLNSKGANDTQENRRTGDGPIAQRKTGGFSFVAAWRAERRMAVFVLNAHNQETLNSAMPKSAQRTANQMSVQV